MVSRIRDITDSGILNEVNLKNPKKRIPKRNNKILGSFEIQT
jgi:hypothetical protein